MGVELNTASASLLTHISGLSAARAGAIVSARPAGGYTSRAALLGVKGIGPKTFEQAAGFLRVSAQPAARAAAEDAAAAPAGGKVAAGKAGGKARKAAAAAAIEPLDCTAVHPESYAAARATLSHLGCAPSELSGAEGRRRVAARVRAAQANGERRAGLAAAAAAGMGVGAEVGERSLGQLLEALASAQRDPRDELPGPLLLGSSLRSLADLQPGQRLDGVVRNVTPFGCFVDVGLKDDGLVHISEMSSSRVTEPLDVVAVGQPVSVVVLTVDLERRRLGLSMKRAADGGEGSSMGSSHGREPRPPCVAGGESGAGSRADSAPGPPPKKARRE